MVHWLILVDTITQIAQTMDFHYLLIQSLELYLGSPAKVLNTVNPYLEHYWANSWS